MSNNSNSDSIIFYYRFLDFIERKKLLSSLQWHLNYSFKLSECVRHWLKGLIMCKIMVVKGTQFVGFKQFAFWKWSHEILNRRSNHVKMQIHTYVIIMQKILPSFTPLKTSYFIYIVLSFNVTKVWSNCLIFTA